MVSAGRFRGGSFQPNTVPRRSTRPPGPGGSGSPTENVFDTYQRADWALEQSDALNESLTQQQITPYWLTPIGETGFYVTPDEPADPTDCDRYPDSPWCGQSGVDPVSLATFSPLSTDLIFTANQDGTEYCLRIDFSLFALALPPGHICYRTPDARPFDDTPPSLDLPDDPDYGNVVDPVFYPVNFGSNPNCLYLPVVDFQHPLIGGQQGYNASTRTWRYTYTSNPVYGGMVGYYTHMGYYSWRGTFPTGTPSLCWFLTFVYMDSEGSRFTGFEYDVWSEHPGSTFPRQAPVFVDLIPTGICTTDPPPPRPRVSTPPPHPLEPMSCCNTAEIEEMLRLLIKRLGADKYPVTVPKSLVDNEKDKVKHESLTELLFWKIQQMDALIGQFPIEIEIEDTDPTKEGNQTQKLSFPNIAETLAEIFGTVAKSAINSDLTVDFLMRLAVESIQIKNAAIITQDYARSNADYLGYKGKMTEREIPCAFNPKGVNSIEKLLQESTYKIAGWESVDEESVLEYLQKIVFAAGIIKGIFFRNKDDTERMVKEMRNLLDPNSDENIERDENWRDFISGLNNENSGFNVNATTKPNVEGYTGLEQVPNQKGTGNSNSNSNGGG